MINNVLTKNSEFLLKAELDQAWSHYRHLEETRGKYLNFFFTIFLASIGFMLTLAKDFDVKVTVETYFGFAVFVFSLFLISAILLAAIVRIGYVLSSYENIMKETRKYFHGESSPVLDVWDIRKGIPSSVNKGVFSIQKSSRALVMCVCLMLSILQMGVVREMYSMTMTLKSGYVVATIGFIAIMIITLLYIVFSIKKASDEIEHNKSNQQGTGEANASA